METSRYLYEVLSTFWGSFSNVYHLERVATFFFMPFIWGFVCFVLCRNTSKKKLWMAVGVAFPVVLLAFRMGSGAFFECPALILLDLIPYFIGIAASFFFNIRKKWHWALLPVIALLVHSAFALWEVFPPMFFPFGKIVDEPLSQEARELAGGADFELRVKFADAWYMDARVTALRVKGDSIYACFLKGACGVSYSEMDSCSWQPLETLPQATPEMRDVAQIRFLKDSVIAYQEEMMTEVFWDGYIFEITLLDYGRSAKRYLEIGNAKLAQPMDLKRAKRLQTMAEVFLTPYDDSPAHRDSLKHCFDE